MSGVATFVVVNAVLFLMAYPTMPNPGPQQDIRLPLYGVVILVIVITFLGKTGLAFGTGFASGFVAELLFLSGCTMHWADPGGTALADARAARRVEAAAVEAEARAKRKWMSEVRSRGLDLAVGVHRLRLATGCVIAHRKKEGKYPPVEDSLPESEICYELHRIKEDESGWRVLYSRIPGPRGGDSLQFRLTVGPDAALRMKGPLLETDSYGILLKRESAGAPAYAVGSPLQSITGVVMDCIAKNSAMTAESKDGVLTLRELLFHPGHCGRLQLEQVKDHGNSNYVVDDPNIAWLFLPTTRPFVGIPLDDISTSWLLTYVPRGKKPVDGYDLHVRPLSYGFTGLRSYLFTGGRIYATSEDRRATTEDPVAELCEMSPAKACGA